MKKRFALLLAVTILLSALPFSSALVATAATGSSNIQAITGGLEADADHPYSLAFDGDPNTYWWSSKWDGDAGTESWKQVTNPIDITLKEATDLDSLSITWACAADGQTHWDSNNGHRYRSDNYIIWVSRTTDGENFELAGETGVMSYTEESGSISVKKFPNTNRNGNVDTHTFSDLEGIRRIRLARPTESNIGYMGQRLAIAEIAVNGTTSAYTLPGDANGDGRVSVIDAVLTSRYVVGGYSVNMNVDTVDTNGDDKISLSDVVRIARYIVDKDDRYLSEQHPLTPASVSSSSQYGDNAAQYAVDGRAETAWICREYFDISGVSTTPREYPLTVTFAEPVILTDLHITWRCDTEGNTLWGNSNTTRPTTYVVYGSETDDGDFTPLYTFTGNTNVNNDTITLSAPTTVKRVKISSFTVIDGKNEGRMAIREVRFFGNAADMGMTFTASGDGYELTAVDNAKMVEIPATYLGKPVVSIAADAFNACTSLKSVSVPYTVTNIANGTFDGCTALESVLYTGTATLAGTPASATLITNADNLFYTEGGKTYWNVKNAGAKANNVANDSLYFNTDAYGYYLEDGVFCVDDDTFDRIYQMPMVGDGAIRWLNFQVSSWDNPQDEFDGILPVSKMNDPLYVEICRPNDKDADSYVGSRTSGRRNAGIISDPLAGHQNIIPIGAIYLNPQYADIPDDTEFTLCFSDIKCAIKMTGENWKLVNDLPKPSEIQAIYPLPWQLESGDNPVSSERLPNSRVKQVDDHYEITLYASDFRPQATDDPRVTEKVYHFWGSIYYFTTQDGTKEGTANGMDGDDLQGVVSSYTAWIKEPDKVGMLVADIGADIRGTVTAKQLFTGVNNILTTTPKTIIGHNVCPVNYDEIMDTEHVQQLIGLK